MYRNAKHPLTLVGPENSQIAGYLDKQLELNLAHFLQPLGTFFRFCKNNKILQKINLFCKIYYEKEKRISLLSLHCCQQIFIEQNRNQS